MEHHSAAILILTTCLFSLAACGARAIPSGTVTVTSTTAGTGTTAPMSTTATTSSEATTTAVGNSWQFTYAAHTITVTNGSTCVQTIAFPDGAADDAEAFYRTVITGDYNFDGNTDISIPRSVGVSNVYYQFWLWDSQTSSYVANDALSALPSPQIDTEHDSIETYESVSATEYEAKTYIWDDNNPTQLILAQRNATTVTEEGGLLFTNESYDSHGACNWSNNFTITAEQVIEYEDAIIYATDAVKAAYGAERVTDAIYEGVTDEVDGVLRHAIVFDEAYAILTTVYVAVGDLHDMIEVPSNRSDLAYRVLAEP